MTSQDLYREALVRAAYRALLQREPEMAVLSAQSQERLPDFEDFAATYLRGMVESLEFGERRDILEFSPETWASVTLPDGLEIRIDLGDFAVSRACMTGCYEPPETAFVDRHVQPGATFVDVGANIGWFALRAGRRVTPSGRVIAIEPRSTTSENLCRSVAQNGFSGWVEVHRMALADKPGVRYIGSDPTGRNPGATWFLATEKLLQDYREAQNTIQETLVDTLDTVVNGRKVDIIKIDVEGAELLVFKGGASTLQASRPIILSEINRPGLERVSQVSIDDYIRYFRNIEYDCRTLNEDGSVGAPAVVSELKARDPGVVSVVFIPL